MTKIKLNRKQSRALEDWVLANHQDLFPKGKTIQCVADQAAEAMGFPVTFSHVRTTYFTLDLPLPRMLHPSKATKAPAAPAVWKSDRVVLAGNMVRLFKEFNLRPGDDLYNIAAGLTSDGNVLP